MSYACWDIMLYSCWKPIDISEEHVSSIFGDEEAKQETSVKAGGKQSGVTYQKIEMFATLLWELQILSRKSLR